MSNTTEISDKASKEDLENVIKYIEKNIPRRENDFGFTYLREICIMAVKSCIENLKPEPSPNIEEHIGRPMPNHPNGGILNGWIGKFPFVEPLNYEGRDKMNRTFYKKSIPNGGILGSWVDIPSPIADLRKKILDAPLNKINEEIMDSLTASHKNLETLNPVKMGKKKMQAEIERLKQVVERLEAEKAELKDKQLNFDLEAVKGILSRHGDLKFEIQVQNPWTIHEVDPRKKIVFTLHQL